MVNLRLLFSKIAVQLVTHGTLLFTFYFITSMNTRKMNQYYLVENKDKRCNS